MKILIDANLSYRLVKKLADVFPECLHVGRTGLAAPASDEAIWGWALENHFDLIVTNDEDFVQLSERHGHPPKVVMLRMGNQSTSFIAHVLRGRKAELEHFARLSDYGYLEIY